MSQVSQVIIEWASSLLFSFFTSSLTTLLPSRFQMKMRLVFFWNIPTLKRSIALNKHDVVKGVVFLATYIVSDFLKVFLWSYSKFSLRNRTKLSTTLTFRPINKKNIFIIFLKPIQLSSGILGYYIEFRIYKIFETITNSSWPE